MPEFGEIWDGPGDNWYPGDDDDENNLYDCDDPNNPAWGDCSWGIVTSDEGDEDDGVYWPGDNDDGITTDDFDHWPGGREFPS